VDPETKEVVVEQGTPLTRELISKMTAAGVRSILISRAEAPEIMAMPGAQFSPALYAQIEALKLLKKHGTDMVYKDREFKVREMFDLAGLQEYRDYEEKYLPKLCSGETLWGFGLTEPNAGSDAGNTQTTAQVKGDQWVINGSKIFITNGSTKITAGVTALCRTGSRDDGRPELSCILIESGTPGFEAREMHGKMPHPIIFPAIDGMKEVKKIYSVVEKRRKKREKK